MNSDIAAQVTQLKQALIKERRARAAILEAREEDKKTLSQALRVLGDFKLEEARRRRELDEKTREVQSAINIFEHQHGRAKRLDLELQLFNSVALFSQEKVTFEKSLHIITEAICELYQLPLAVIYVTSPAEQESAEGSSQLKKLFHFASAEEKYQPLVDYDHETYVNNNDCIVRKAITFKSNQSGSLIEEGDVFFDSDLFTEAPDDEHVVVKHQFDSSERVELARSVGVKTQFCVPVICNGDVIAVLEFFDVERDSSDTEAIRFISTISLQLGNMQERVLAERNVRKNYRELKRAQRQLVQSEKLASLGQLSAGIAHEINNPVGFVLSNMGSLREYVEIIRKVLEEQEAYIAADAAGELSRKKAIVETISSYKASEDFDFVLDDLDGLLAESTKGMERVKEIVSGLSSFARTEGATASNADVNEIIESTINMVWNELKYKVTLEKDYAQLPTIRCYPSKLGQVFLNLIVNAGHAISESGVISISTALVDEEIRISIADTGAGIAPENIEKLFNPFFTTKPVGEGTGLGLSISYGIIIDHEGRIQVESEVGKGTCFTIYLPLNSEL
ncbi:MAG: GAF domain-containing protein [Pseudomonadales bacterium]|nr:GAF domain-containing protein [Pseudomonadales bacterium]